MALDTTNADALAGAAFVDVTASALGWSDQSVDLYGRAMQRANQALLLNPDQATAHYVKARLIMMKAKPNDATSANEVIAEAEASLRADPSLDGAYWAMAVGEQLLGRYEQSMSDLEQAMRISTRDAGIGLWRMEMGRDLLALRRIRGGSPGRPQGHRLGVSNGDYLMPGLAAFYAAADKTPEAKAMLAEALKVNPKLSHAFASTGDERLCSNPTSRRPRLRPEEIAREIYTMPAPPALQAAAANSFDTAAVPARVAENRGVRRSRALGRSLALSRRLARAKQRRYGFCVAWVQARPHGAWGAR